MFTIAFRRRARRAAPSLIAASLFVGATGCTPGADVPTRLDATPRRA